MEFKDLIAARRSVRSYQSGACHKDLEAICKAAQQAPSWMNQQTARCYVLETPEVLETLRDAALPGFNKKSSANAALIVTTFVKGIVGFGPDGQPVDDIGNGWGIPPSSKASSASVRTASPWMISATAGAFMTWACMTPT